MTKHVYLSNHQKYGEINLEPSQTIPGESLTMKQIIEKYAMGIPLDRRNVEYFDQEDLDYINKFYQPGSLDLTDLDELQTHISTLQNSVTEAMEKAKAAESTPQPAAIPPTGETQGTTENNPKP